MLRKPACAGRFNGTALLLKRAWSTSGLSGIGKRSRFLLSHVLFGKPVSTFPGHALKSEEYPMRQWLIMLGPALALMGLQTSHAQVTVDIRKITCNEFLSGQLTDSRSLAIWLNGYLNGARGNTLIDPLSVTENNLIDYCLSHNNMLVLDAARNVVGVAK
jgi:acid stress chaperone HdeB